MKTHKERVAELVITDKELIEMLFVPAIKQVRTGPKTPAFAEKKHKTAVYLSGTNTIFLKHLVKLSKENDDEAKTKSMILNSMMEYCLKNNSDDYIKK